MIRLRDALLDDGRVLAAGCVVVILVLFALVASLAHDADHWQQRAVDAEARYVAHDQDIATRCTIFVDGSASCPAGVFAVPTTTTTAVAK